MHGLGYYSKKLNLEKDVEYIFNKNVIASGNRAIVDCPVRYIGKTVYVIVIVLEQYVEIVLKRKVTRSGNRAQINCPVKYLGKKVYVLVKRGE